MAPARQCLVFRLSTRHPADIAPLRALLDGGELRAEEIVAILGKTEGNGCVNQGPDGGGPVVVIARAPG